MKTKNEDTLVPALDIVRLSDRAYCAATVQRNQRGFNMLIDATISSHGSVSLVHLSTDAARDWVRDNVGDEAQYFGNALAVEPRYLANLVDGMQGAGLVIA